MSAKHVQLGVWIISAVLLDQGADRGSRSLDNISCFTGPRCESRIVKFEYQFCLLDQGADLGVWSLDNT